ncbi:hypothetical protein NLI96_g6637 [Meripilus lineatus]|uniref:EF-hand domain-containing protein n=1 Tax=Meripilus lineatus TaxID=2056292 RepID=A0AAD5YHX0_9APHY|nr:hypothetical protein NLI96_g6637 [Physisporinus lineatus]
MRRVVVALLLAAVAQGHGGHEAHDGPAKGETIQQYAQRHMSKEHHIDNFDVDSFFQLHDLNRDHVWDRDEIEAVYGVHHVYSQKKSKDEVEHQKKADHIVNTVLSLIDKDGDGKITMEEFKVVGLDGLPNFDDLGAEGHHYDVESEFFLHHEEEFHNTPETQTDESYVHAEDIEHFAHHEQIERQEAEKEAKFQGISVEEALKQHDPEQQKAEQQPGDGHQEHIKPVDATETGTSTVSGSSTPKFTRTPPEDPIARFQKAKAEASKEEWGSGEEGYKPPKSPSDRMRKNVPYKDRMQYKFRRAWGDF